LIVSVRRRNSKVSGNDTVGVAMDTKPLIHGKKKSGSGEPLY